MKMKQGDFNLTINHFIGQAKVTEVSPLAGAQGGQGRLIAIGHMPTTHAIPNIDARTETSSLDHVDVLVAGTNCNMDKLLSAVVKLKEKHPTIKVVLAASSPCPHLEGVSSVLQVSQEEAELGRRLLLQQAGILAGSNAGQAAFLAFCIHANAKAGTTIAMVTTNLSPELLSLPSQPESD